MSIRKDSTLREVAFVVCTALEDVGVTAILSGGGAATVYAPDAIQSLDLDFILTVYAPDEDPTAVLARLGYHRIGHDYRHSISPYPLEFPPGPLAVGNELLESWSTLRDGARLLHILTPTDSCRDRLAAFYHFGDRSSLDQAAAVYNAQREVVELELIKEWSEREDKSQRFEEFQLACGG